MSKLLNRVICPECGAVRICHRGSLYAVCPRGHGKLVRRFTRAEAKEAIASLLPRARRVGSNKFQVDGHDGLFGYRNGAGLKPVEPGAKVKPDEVIARHVTRTRQLVRVYARIAPRKTRSDDES